MTKGSAAERLAVIILAAGLGKRMNSSLPKALVRTDERPLIEHVLLTATSLAPERLIIVTGHKGEEVERTVNEGSSSGLYGKTAISFARQREQRGTGDAVRSALTALDDFVGPVVILCADVPLLKSETLTSMLARHRSQSATITLLTLVASNPKLYGRILRSAQSGKIEAIIEARDCTPEQLLIDEINAAVYVVESAFLKPAVEGLENNNAQKEYYLTDIVSRAVREGQGVEAVVSRDEDEVEGVNTLVDLAEVNGRLRRNRINRLIESGVHFVDPASCFIDSSCSIAPGAQIGPQVQLVGKTVISEGAKLDGQIYLKDASVGARTHIRICVRAESAIIGEECIIGPFAHLRPGSKLSKTVHVGNFVETKNSFLAEGAKANHLTYLGDCEIGENSNIGAGTITCNYDGVNKHKTIIGKNVFVGSNSALVAPVTVDDGATIGAGSVITKDVEKDALALTRAPQISKKGWKRRTR
ncbi:MAG: bifunctional UDP-N-acetylglucosamine diphosphorylase/glucosamine-1-phosphate N-acetyltransferase GlmU [Oligoflexia bacterium]|nr:bifunctional UDP-N-acetylglucosamine diphosphorylase/glucosamine-1-phosphate N-acetyltransferase GlmU [Oligoflexia bacterium]